MALDEKTVNINVKDITNDSGVIIGYEAKYQDAGREYVISYDADFVKTILEILFKYAHEGISLCVS